MRPAQHRTLALGRLKAGQMNKSEAAYAVFLEGLKAAGEVQWWRFEGVTLKLAENTRLTVDFAVLAADGVMEMHDVKGNWFQDDAKVKTKVAAELFPFRFFVVRPKAKRDGGGWAREAF